MTDAPTASAVGAFCCARARSWAVDLSITCHIACAKTVQLDMAKELIKAGEGTARGPLTGNVIRCTCGCPELTHTGPDGHCIEPFCRDEPCTPISEWRREQAQHAAESSVEGRVARHLASTDWPTNDAEYMSLAREVIAIVEAE